MDGRECVIADYPELASYMYNTYGSYTQFGGNGTTTFGLPNLNISVTDANNNVIQMYHYIKYR
jgi:microcystin-dependent protein